MKLYPSATCGVAALLLSTAAACAQEYQIRVLSLGLNPPAAELHVHEPGGKTGVAKLEPKNFLNHESTTVKLKKPKMVLTTGPDAESAEDPAALVGECELPQKGGSLILLLVPEAAGPACKIVVVDDSVKSFPPGSIKVVNLTETQIRIDLEKKPFEFKPGEMRPILKPPVNDANASAMSAAALQPDGKWQAFSTGIWPSPGEKRVLQVVAIDADGGHPVLRGFRDVAVP